MEDLQLRTVWISVYSANPSSPNSTPSPDRFTPPKGALGWIAPCLLIHTDPHSIRAATALAASISFDQTEPPKYLVELALRIGSLSSSALIARRVGLVRRQLVASPALFETNRPPLLPEHLAALPCITYARLTPNNQWVFESETGRHVVTVNPNIICDEADVITEAALEGLGVAILSSWCAHRLRDLIIELSDKFMFDAGRCDQGKQSRHRMSISGALFRLQIPG